MDYRPIPGHKYAELEIAILHRIQMRMAWNTFEGKTCIDRLTPIDLRIRDQAEFLLAEDSRGYPVEIRLDRIARFTPL